MMIDGYMYYLLTGGGKKNRIKWVDLYIQKYENIKNTFIYVT